MRVAYPLPLLVYQSSHAEHTGRSSRPVIPSASLDRQCPIPALLTPPPHPPPIPTASPPYCAQPPSPPTPAERLDVADHLVIPATALPAEITAPRLSQDEVRSPDDIHPCRRLDIGHAGRLRVSWSSRLTVAGSQDPQATPEPTRGNQGGAPESLRGATVAPGASCPLGYSWAIVRTRGGGCGGGRGRQSPAPLFPSPARILQRGVVLPPRGGGDKAGENASLSDDTHGAAETAAGSVGPAGCRAADPPALSPVPWSTRASNPLKPQAFECETTGWLPGDVLTLWISVYLDHRAPSTEPSLIGEPQGGGSYPGAAEGRPGQLTARDSFRPSVRAFELRAVDDADSDELLRRLFRPRPSAALAERTLGKGARASTAGAVPEPVPLGLATPFPMNIAAAGGSWG